VKDSSLTWKRLGLTVFVSGFMWICGYSAYFVSLALTSAESGVAIYNSSAVWVFIFSAIFLGERVSIIKSFAILFCICGTVMISFGDVGTTQQSQGASYPLGWLGDIICGISAVIFAAYSVHYKFYLNKFKEPGMSLVALYISTLGLFNLLFYWPVILVLNVSGLEIFEWPSLQDLPFFALMQLLVFVLDIVIWIGIPLTSPLFIALANVLAIPCAVVVDYTVSVLQNQLTSLQPLKLGGIALIILGFGALELRIPFLDSHCKWKRKKEIVLINDE